MRPTVLSIAGSDSSGGAGIQADLKSIEANGGYAATVLTGITAQNTRGVERTSPLSPELVRAQVEAVFEDLRVVAVKSGMLGEAVIVGELARALDRYRPAYYVCDPVMFSSGGLQLLDDEGVEALRRLLLPRATLVTPNVREAERLSGAELRDSSQVERVGRLLLEAGARAVLVTGGHLSDRPATDFLVTAEACSVFPGEPVDTAHDHGSGCVYASAIATGLARGLGLRDAVGEAKRFVTEAIRHGLAIGAGSGPVDPFFGLESREARARRETVECSEER